MDRIKAEIRSYRQYQKYAIKIGEKLDEIWYEATGVKGIRYDKAHFNVDPSISHEKKLQLFELKDWYVRELDRVSKQIEYVDNILAMMDDEDRELVEYTLIDGHSYRQAEMKFYLSRSGISKRIDRIIEDVSTNLKG